MENRKAVVTGGAGFIGSYLVKALLNNGWSVLVLDNFSTGTMDNLEPHPNLIIEATDIISSKLPTYKFDTLFHLAAPVSVPESIEQPMKYWNGICVASRRVMSWAYEMGATSMVAASTAAVYGDSELMPLKESDTPNPMSPYAEFKLEMEHMMMSYNKPQFKCSALRFFNVFGEGQRSTGGYRSAVPIFLQQYESYQPITVTGDGEQTRDWIYVKDVVNAIIMSSRAEFKTTMPIYNVGSGAETQVIEVAEAFGGEIKQIEKREEPMRSVADITKITRQLGWKPETNLLSWIKSIK
jgi:UDP-glucose 4-epimerase